MIHYHGTPITPVESALRMLAGRHAFVSYAAPQSMPIVLDVCQSFALDNGAYSAWRQGRTAGWEGYYGWVDSLSRRPGFDWAVIPDVIDGSEIENDLLVKQWPLGKHIGVPVWHMHESLDRLRKLADEWPRVALGSSGDFATIGTRNWWLRMSQAMNAVTDEAGLPRAKLHGLRMLAPDVFTRLPLSSADSTNVAQNMGLAWRGVYEPVSKSTKGIVIAERIESQQSAPSWNKNPEQTSFTMEVQK